MRTWVQNLNTQVNSWARLHACELVPQHWGVGTRGSLRWWPPATIWLQRARACSEGWVWGERTGRAGADTVRHISSKSRGRSHVLGSYAVGCGVIIGLRTVIYLPLRLLSIKDWKRMCGSLGTGCMLVISALGMLKQEAHCKSEASQGETLSLNEWMRTLCWGRDRCEWYSKVKLEYLEEDDRVGSFPGF